MESPLTTSGWEAVTALEMGGGGGEGEWKGIEMREKDMTKKVCELENNANHVIKTSKYMYM